MHVLIHAALVPECGTQRVQRQPRVLAHGEAPFRRKQTLRPIGANMGCTGKVLRKYYDAHRLPAGKTAAREFERGVLPVRQLNNPEVDDYKCPRH